MFGYIEIGSARMPPRPANTMNAEITHAKIGRVMKKRLAGHVSEVRYTFGDTDLTVDDALEHCVHPYHVFMAVCESKRIFALLLTPRVGYMIDKRDMKPAEIEALRANKIV